MMSEQRKRIFKDALFIIPFLLVVTVLSLGLMFLTGRDAKAIMQLVTENFNSNQDMSVSVYTESFAPKKYTLKYSEISDSENEPYAVYVLNKKGDDPTETLTLSKQCDGFEAGVYKIEWFHQEQYVTFTPLDYDAQTVSYQVAEQPFMYEYVKSYSWDNLLSTSGATYEVVKGYKLLGFISAFTWDSETSQNILWGLGGNPQELYIYSNVAEQSKKIAVSK
ncbi:MAG: hypothetical protein VZR27_11740 [Acutalibacteraceae bacterium]|nr:hypothetical protein [Acutalibacteraceae bacterium]